MTISRPIERKHFFFFFVNGENGHSQGCSLLLTQEGESYGA